MISYTEGEFIHSINEILKYKRKMDKKNVQIPQETLLKISNSIIGTTNPRHIPSAVFMENVEDFLSSLGLDIIEPVIGALQQLYSKYKFMEMNLLKSKTSFKSKIPDTEKDIQMIENLILQKGKTEILKVRFNLADNVYANAVINPNQNKVCIWLGANVMVEYNYDEALELLTNNLKHAQERMEQINEDLAFLRDQIITTEVNIARIFNFDVRRRRKEKDLGSNAKVVKA